MNINSKCICEKSSLKTERIMQILCCYLWVLINNKNIRECVRDCGVEWFLQFWSSNGKIKENALSCLIKYCTYTLNICIKIYYYKLRKVVLLTYVNDQNVWVWLLLIYYSIYWFNCSTWECSINDTINESSRTEFLIMSHAFFDQLF